MKISKKSGVLSKRGASLSERLATAARELANIRQGKAQPARRWIILEDGKGGFIRRQVDPSRPAIAQVTGAELTTSVRSKLGLSQAEFAALIGIPVGTLRGWEQGRREPDGAARVLLLMTSKDPEAFLAAARSQARAA